MTPPPIQRHMLAALTALALSMALPLLPGCGKAAEVTMEELAETAIEQQLGGDAQIEYDNDDGKVTMQIAEGDSTITMQAGESIPLPADFPADVPVPENVNWHLVQVNSEDGSIMLQGTLDTALSDVASMLEASAAKQGWEPVQNITQGEMSMMVMSKGEQTLSYTLGSSDGKTTVTVARG